MEKEDIQKKRVLSAPRCPRKEAFKALGALIEDLQDKHHKTILMIDANQTSRQCTTAAGTKSYSIEGLQIKYDMDDPFVQLIGQRPPTTTSTPGQDIDYILTYDIDPINITTLPPDTPAISDHLGLCMDIDIMTALGEPIPH
jgi:endonuclease/exonuclease/phosphatase family metal-dependent hydrolase